MGEWRRRAGAEWHPRPVGVVPLRQNNERPLGEWLEAGLTFTLGLPVAGNGMIKMR